ncbi:MAG: hypothetical protein KC418_06520 [Anaerolineales bacterium]|nr:hypothetical protein [Anaerolineales bacterium]MCB8952938.1 hypothetical protein [Ardenticatenales bacterium]
MDPYEPHTHTFVIRLWLEESAQEQSETVWRGHITHLLTQKRRYLQTPDEIIFFILPYLVEMGVKLQMKWRIKWWLARWRQRHRPDKSLSAVRRT